ncbi:MAG: hypothetical protein LBF81_04660, partial [Prevotellaceae bacterium]|nr:hypothetical protein [Prevotellaceae bacterium]
ANCTGTTSAAKTVTISACGNVPGCPGLQLYQTTSSNDGTALRRNAHINCANQGARLPTLAELECMCANRLTLPGGWNSGHYWTGEQTASGTYYMVRFMNDGCSIYGGTTTNYERYRCVL